MPISSLKCFRTDTQELEPLENPGRFKAGLRDVHAKKYQGVVSSFEAPLRRSTLLMQAHPWGEAFATVQSRQGAVERSGAQSTSQTRATSQTRGLMSHSG